MKKLLQDMVKKNNPNSRTIREIEKPSKKESIRIIIKDDSNYIVPKIKNNNGGNNSVGFRYGLWFVALIAVIFLLFAISFLFSGAKVTVNPKTQDLVLNQNLDAIKDSGNGSGNDNLSFDLMAISGQETKTIQGGPAKDVALKAKGTVRIFNAFSAMPQKLAMNTRLIGSNGKIYKTEAETTVPGVAADGTPGSVEVGIYGETAGPEYNSTPLDFKISGFKGTDKYSKIYARSEGDITGGLQGKFAQISDDQKTNAVNDLRNVLQADLLKKATDQIPDGYILFKDAVFFDDDGGSADIASANGLVPVNLSGTLYGFLFKKDDLTKRIVQENVESYDGSDVYISNLQGLTFSLANKETSFENVTSINFTLTGSAKVVWKVDTDKLTADLLGKRKGDFNQILSEYPNIDSADLTIKPVWGMSFPDKSQDIKVVVNYPK